MPDTGRYRPDGGLTIARHLLLKPRRTGGFGAWATMSRVRKLVVGVPSRPSPPGRRRGRRRLRGARSMPSIAWPGAFAARPDLACDPWVAILGFPFVTQAMAITTTRSRSRRVALITPWSARRPWRPRCIRSILDESWLVPPDANCRWARWRAGSSSTPRTRPLHGDSGPARRGAAPRRRTTPPGGTTESGISGSTGWSSRARRGGRLRQERVSISVDLSVAGPDATTLVMTATGVLTGAGTADQQVPEDKTGCGARRVLHRACPGKAAVRHRPDQRGSARLRCDHRGHRRGSNHRPRRVQTVMSSS